jgi:hypothetical protein
MENDVLKLNVAHIPCRCGFSLRVKTVAKKDGSGFIRIQDNRCYRLEIAGAQQQAAPEPQVAFGQTIAPKTQVIYPNPFQPQNQEGGSDDLPF